MNILFVCTGNICRSPLAERMLQHRVAELDLDDVVVSSAGTRALNGKAMHPESRRVLGEYGIDPGEFTSRMLTESLTANADIVLGMAREHRAVARQLAPIRWRRMYALREIVGTAVKSGRMDGATATDPTDGSLDIEDPIGKPGNIFDNVGAEIYQLIDSLAYWITDENARPIKTSS